MRQLSDICTEPAEYVYHWSQGRLFRNATQAACRTGVALAPRECALFHFAESKYLSKTCQARLPKTSKPTQKKQPMPARPRTTHSYNTRGYCNTAPTSVPPCGT